MEIQQFLYLTSSWIGLIGKGFERTYKYVPFMQYISDIDIATNEIST